MKRPTPDVLGESAIAMAGALLSDAIERSGMKRSALADALGISRPAVNGMLADNITVRRLGRVLGVLGFRLKLSIEKLP